MRLEVEELVTRVECGILFHAKEDDIREQLWSEGYTEQVIEFALAKGKRLAEVRLNPKEI